MDWAERTCNGRLFQARGPATLKALLPSNVHVLGGLGPLFRRSAIPRVRYSEGPLFRMLGFGWVGYGGAGQLQLRNAILKVDLLIVTVFMYPKIILDFIYIV